MRMKDSLWAKCLIAGLAATVLAGCSAGGTGSGNLVSPDETYEKEPALDSTYQLRDKDSLYEEEDTGVITMYLTVGKGSESEGTNYTWDQINSYSLEYFNENQLSPYKCEAVLQVGDENGPISGEFGYGELAANATVQVRGTGASRQQQKSYRINILEGKGKWESQKAVVLNKHLTDPLRFTNKLAYSLMEEIPAMISARTRFVHLYVKDKTEGADGLFQDYGLFTQVEQINKTYLKNHGFDNDGQLYQAENFDWRPHEDSIKAATDPSFVQADFEQYLEIKGNEDHTKLLRLLQAVNDPSVSIGQVLDTYFDRGNLYYWMGFHMLMGNKDVETENYYLYSPQTVDKWYLISWNNSASFDEAYRKLRDENYDSSWNHGIFTYISASLYSRIFQDPACREEFRGVVEDLKDNYLTAQKVQEKADEYREITEPYVYGMPDKIYARLTRENYEILAGGISGEIEKNYQSFLDSMEEPWPFHILAPETSDGVLRLRWEPSWMFQEGEVSYSVELSSDFMFREYLRNETVTGAEELTVDMLPAGKYFLRVRSGTPQGAFQDAYEYYIAESGSIVSGTLCFYVLEDGTIAVSEYEEGD